MGGLVGAALVYANYFHAIDIYEGGRGVRTLKTAGLFATYSVVLSSFPFAKILTLMIQIDYMTNVSAFFSEFLATAVLVILLLAAMDRQNLAPPHGLLPLYIFFVFLGIACALGMETGTVAITLYFRSIN